MRILILGGDGMLGHQLFKYLLSRHEVRVTLRQEMTSYMKFGLFNTQNAYTGIDVRYLERIMEVLADFHPLAVVNCVGIVKHRPASKESIPSMEINALFPHRLAVLCKAINARLVHLSTDCVFSGKKGNYLETDPSDAEDLYGKSKFLGEVHDSHCLTLRTSMIGRELSSKKSLLEWFLAQSGTVKGFKNAIFSGFTTLELSRIIEKMLVNHYEASGVYHVSSDPINKFDLLTLIKEKMHLAVEIIPDETFYCDRSLDSTRFRREFNYTPPTWEAMVEELSKDFTEERL
ncbi:RmlD substrate binding domain protein [uncultured archaeon]|nr:RmlD substrate binding domain protein [uncultured archaeon]